MTYDLTLDEARRRAAVLEAIDDDWDPTTVLAEEEKAYDMLYADVGAEQQRVTTNWFRLVCCRIGRPAVLPIDPDADADAAVTLRCPNCHDGADCADCAEQPRHAGASAVPELCAPVVDRHAPSARGLMWPGAVDLGCSSARALTDDRGWCPSSAPGINAIALQDDVIERAVTACADTVPTNKAF